MKVHNVSGSPVYKLMYHDDDDVEDRVKPRLMRRHKPSGHKRKSTGGAGSRRPARRGGGGEGKRIMR